MNHVEFNRLYSLRNNYKSNNIQSKQYIDFSQKPDTLDLSTKHQPQRKKSGANILRFAFIGLMTAGIGFSIYKNNISKLKNLSPDIEFKKAKTIEDAVKFGKKTLGIKEYIGFSKKDLDVINWINEGLVNSSNSLEGKIKMPKKIGYTGGILPNNTLAGVAINQKGKNKHLNGLFILNKDIFDNIDFYTKTRLENAIEGGLFAKTEDGSYLAHKYIAKNDNLDEVLSLIKKFNNNEKIAFNDKLRLLSSLDDFNNLPFGIQNAPYIYSKNILTNENIYNKICGKKEKAMSMLNQIENMPLKDQAGSAVHLIEKLGVAFDFKPSSPFKVIYHEMGHLQDKTPRLSSIEKFNFNPDDYPEELKKWITENYQVINSVSAYSSYGPGEFIAETFSALLSGKKLPNEAIELYKKMQGPKIPNIV